jgi:hypothetical protein
MAFHRLTAPTYFAGLGPGYDYVNNLVVGTPAVADGPKADGPNAGTYFVGKGEDALARAANRGLKAVTENTDYLDDLLHRDIAVMKTTGALTAVSPVSSIGLSDANGVYIGKPGTPNSVSGINQFIEILDGNNNEIIGDLSTGAPCRVTAISETVGTSFAGPGVTVTCTISPPIPAGTTYRVVYAVRGTLADLPVDGFTFMNLRGAQQQDAETLDFIYQASRRTGADVDALVATNIETPNGVRLAKAAVMDFDVDADASLVGSLHGFRFRRERDGTPKYLGRLVQDPADPIGLQTRLEFGGNGTDNGIGVPTGRVVFFDGNITTEGLAVSMPGYVALSAATDGAQYLRVAERTGGAGAPPRSILQALNARAYVTLGDGTNTFGDFNSLTGPGEAWAAWGAASTGTFHIRLKAGTYRVQDGLRLGPIGANQTVIIEGADKSCCIIEGFTSDGKTLEVAGGGRLVLRNVTVRLGVGQTNGGIYCGDGHVEIYNSNIVQQKLVFTNSNAVALLANNTIPSVNFENALFVEDSFLDMDGVVDPSGNFPNIHLLLGDNLEHWGYVVRRTKIRAAEDNAPFKVEATSDAINVTRLREVLFEECTMLLGGTVDLGTGFMRANPGPVWLEPLNSVRKLQIDGLTIRGCDVTANHRGSGTASILMHLIGGSIRYNTTTELGSCILGRVTIEGGLWRMPDSDTSFATWVIQANTLRISNVRCRSTTGLTGAVAKSANAYINGSTSPTASQWGSFSIIHKLESLANVFETYRSTIVDGFHVYNVRQAQALVASGLADVCLAAPSNGFFHAKNVKVHTPLSGTAAGGNYPLYRILCFCNTNPSAVFEEVQFDIGNVTPLTQWTNGGYFILMTGGSSSPNWVKYVNCGVRGGLSTNGILVSSGNALLQDCYANSCLTGLTCAGGNSTMEHTIQGGNFNNNGLYGIYVAATSFWDFHVCINGVRAQYNTSVGLRVTAPENAWNIGPSFAHRSSVCHVTGSLFHANFGVSYIQTLIEMTSVVSGLFGPTGTFIGNSCQHLNADAGPGEAQFAKAGGAFGGELANMRGATSGYAGSTANGAMHDNYAILRNGP